MSGYQEEQEEHPVAHAVPEVKVNLDAAYFKKKQTEGKDRRFPFSKK